MGDKWRCISNSAVTIVTRIFMIIMSTNEVFADIMVSESLTPQPPIDPNHPNTL